MAAVGTITGARGFQVLRHTYTGLVTGETTDAVAIGGWMGLVGVYFIFPPNYVSGVPRVIVAHEEDYAGDWDLFGEAPTNIISSCVRTIQVPGQGVEFLKIRLTSDIVTNPVGGTLEVRIIGH